MEEIIKKLFCVNGIRFCTYRGKKNELHTTLCDTMKNMGQIPNWLGKKPVSVN